MAHSFFTIGHSTRTIEEFVALLRASEVTQVVDVRTVPRSRTNPQYNGDVLGDTLAGFQVGYEHIASLGGLRGRQFPKDDSPNTFWKNRSFRNYADYALSAEFRQGVARLRQIGGLQRTAYMCAETVWWRCHRRIITDYLLAAGEEVFHILDVGHIDTARMTPGAQSDGCGGLIYPAEG
ncbi:MAG: DUF488 domain-containing protein [Alphaproteobacteria bacterium]|nr:MAG: DUF488 domain-containing protein [Alphaproteobacteria bacterium]